MITLRLFSPLVGLVATLPAQAAPGSFADRVGLSVSARNARSILEADGDKDGVLDLFASIPSSNEIHRFDGRTGQRLVLRGPSGINFGRVFTVADLDDAAPHRHVIVASDTGVSAVPADTMSGGFGVPSPTLAGFLLSAHWAELDGDANDEVVFVGNTGIEYYDSDTNSNLPIEQGVPLSDVFGQRSYVRRGIGATDRIVTTAYGLSPARIYEYDGATRRTLAHLPPTVQALDAIIGAQGKLVVATSDNSFLPPYNGTIRVVDEVGVVLEPVPLWAGSPSQRVRTLTEVDPFGAYFAAVGATGQSEEVLEVRPGGGPPILAIQAPAGTGLDVSPAGSHFQFVDNTRVLVVAERNRGAVSWYQTDRNWDLDVDATYYRGGDTLQTTVRLGATLAGVPVVPVVSLSVPSRLFVPGLIDMSFTFDPFTQVSGALFGGPVTLDGLGGAVISTVLPPPAAINRAYDLSVGVVGLHPSGGFAANRTGVMFTIGN